MKIWTLIWTAFAVTMLLFIAVYKYNETPQLSPRDGVVYVPGTIIYGSGVVIAPGKVLTAKHIVVDNAGLPLSVVVDGAPRLVTKTLVNPDTDAALLVVDVVCPCWNHTVTPEIGDKIIIAGFPFGKLLQTLVVTTGTFQGYTHLEGLRMGLTSATVEPGNSGGPVFVERKGKLYLAGIAVVKLGTGLSMFIPIAEMKSSEFFVSED